MAAALERQTGSQEIRAVCAEEAMQGPTGRASIQEHTHTHTHINTLNVLTFINCYYFYEVHF